MKVLYVSTISNTVNTFLIPHIEMLIENGHEVDVAFKTEQKVSQEIHNMGCSVYELKFSRSVFKNNYSQLINQIKELVSKESYDIVHTHTPIASAIVRLACKNIEDVKIIYTAHGFHFYQGAPLINWLLFYPIEYILSKHTDVLITINQEDYYRAGKFKSKRLAYIPGIGIDTNKLKNTNADKSEKRKSIGIRNDDFMIISVGELNKNKNHQVIIKAISKLNNKKIKYVICGKGILENKLKKLVQELSLEDQVKFLGFRNDVPELIDNADLFAFPSFREGLSVSLMEAMGVGLPVICSNIRGNSDLIEDGKGGYLIAPNDIDNFANAIKKIFLDKQLSAEFSRYNLNQVSKYSQENVINEMKRIYSEI